MRKALFHIDGGQVYVGYTSGRLWNGWATPYFPLEEALKICAEWNDEDNPMTYDEERDEFRIHYDGDEIPYVWEGEDFLTDDGRFHLYGIGAYSHIWDELDDGEKLYLAEQIDEFLIDYNADEFHSEDMLYEAILTKFNNLDIFARCYEIMNDGKLNVDQIYTKLEEILM